MVLVSFGTLAILGVVVAGSVLPSALPQPPSHQGTEGRVANSLRKPCLVAKMKDGRITSDEVHELRSLLQPPPPWPEATRLAVDVWLAGTIAPNEQHSAKSRLEAYRRIHAETRRAHTDMRASLGAVQRRLSAASIEQGLELGPCYIARDDRESPPTQTARAEIRRNGGDR